MQNRDIQTPVQAWLAGKQESATKQNHFMIRLNEIRIGNWLKGANGENHRIDEEGMTTLIHHANLTLTHQTPILLTDKILTDAGFKSVKPRDGVCGAYLKDGIRIERSNSGNYYFKGVPTRVHELQNIYFAIHRKELTINF